jgi:hypothetical protein
VELSLPKTLKVEAMDSDPLVAVDRAANRLGRSIIRQLTMNAVAPAAPSAAGPARSKKRKGKPAHNNRPEHP